MPDTSGPQIAGASPRTLRQWVPTLVGLLGLAVTFAATFQVAVLNQAKDERRFEIWVEKTHSHARERLQHRLTQLQNLTIGLLGSEEGMFGSPFEVHVRWLMEHDPSIRGIGLAVEPPADRAAAPGSPVTRPEAPDSGADADPPPYLSIYFQAADSPGEPAPGNLDIAAEPDLRAAMARALESGSPAAVRWTNPASDAQPDPASHQRAVAIFIPARPPDESDARAAGRPRSRGCVYAILDEARLWETVFLYSPLRVEVYDGLDPEALLWAQPVPEADHRTRFHDTRPLTTADLAFTLAYKPLPEFHAGSLRSVAVGATFIVGLLVTAGLVLLTRTQALAWGAADRAAAKLLASRRQLEEVNRTLERRVAKRTAVAEHRAAQLQRLARRLTRAEQDERRRLARVLHDHLQQVLVAARIQVKLMECNGRPAGPHTGSPPTTQLDDLLQEALDACRSLTVDLSPPVLHTAGLVPALEWLARQTHRKYRLPVHLQADPPSPLGADHAGDGETADRIDEDTRVFLFQAVRELLFNAAKYARADHASVRVTRLPGDRVRVLVEDQGAGFDPAATTEERDNGGFGLFSIRERAQLLGGAMHLHSAPGRGTHIVLTLPCRKPPSKRRAPATAPPPPVPERTGRPPLQPSIAK